MRLQKQILATAIATALVAPVAMASDDHDNRYGAMNTPSANEASATGSTTGSSENRTKDRSGNPAISPYAAPDNSWISISGSVADVRRDRFELDYGDGRVTVEMDDGDRDADAYKLLEGDKVRVLGRVDDDVFESTTIEAMSVQVDKLDTTFYASPRDEERLSFGVAVPITVSETYVNGRVLSVGDDDFVIDTGMSHLTIDVSDMPVDPLDDRGFLQIDTGDRVSVAGGMTSEFFEGRQLEADAIVELSS